MSLHEGHLSEVHDALDAQERADYYSSRAHDNLDHAAAPTTDAYDERDRKQLDVAAVEALLAIEARLDDVVTWLTEIAERGKSK